MDKLIQVATAATLMLSLGVAAAAQKPQSIREGVLDEIELRGPAPAASAAVAVKLFQAGETDLGSGGDGGREGQIAAAKRLQERAPKLLGDALVARLGALGPFTSVSLTEGTTPATGAVTVEGTFSKLDPGSRAKRYFVGFGAGRTTVEVKGTVRDGSGQTLATFVHRRHGAMGVAGGDSADKMADDSASIGEDIAKFLSAWAKGESLK